MQPISYLTFSPGEKTAPPHWNLFILSYRASYSSGEIDLSMGHGNGSKVVEANQSGTCVKRTMACWGPRI